MTAGHSPSSLVQWLHWLAAAKLPLPKAGRREWFFPEVSLRFRERNKYKGEGDEVTSTSVPLTLILPRC
jgi:hypothetical protein